MKTITRTIIAATVAAALLLIAGFTTAKSTTVLAKAGNITVATQTTHDGLSPTGTVAEQALTETSRSSQARAEPNQETGFTRLNAAETQALIMDRMESLRYVGYADMGGGVLRIATYTGRDGTHVIAFDGCACAGLDFKGNLDAYRGVLLANGAIPIMTVGSDQETYFITGKTGEIAVVGLKKMQQQIRQQDARLLTARTGNETGARRAATNTVLSVLASSNHGSEQTTTSVKQGAPIGIADQTRGAPTADFTQQK